eukprot:COSAG01_NODE_1017_length_12107_cov_114.566372_3_plen_73_part_00
MLTEMYLCPACSDHEIDEKNVGQASRSVMVQIDNRTPFSWELAQEQAVHGVWSGARGGGARGVSIRAAVHFD